MKLNQKRKFANGTIIAALILAGWGVYVKQSNLIIIGLVIAGVIAIFEEKIIRWT